jgi:hypothetical protein
MFGVDFFEKIILGMFSLIGAYVLWRVRKMEEKIDRAPSRDEVEEKIDAKLEVIKLDQETIKRDLQYMRLKIDKISDYLLESKHGDY